MTSLGLTASGTQKTASCQGTDTVSASVVEREEAGMRTHILKCLSIFQDLMKNSFC